MHNVAIIVRPDLWHKSAIVIERAGSGCFQCGELHVIMRSHPEAEGNNAHLSAVARS